MIDLLQKLFTAPQGDDERDPEHTRRLAAAALLIEVARADARQDADEDAAMQALLQRSLGLAESEARELLAQANDHVDHATSLYQFTRLVNDHYAPQERSELVANLWRVAYADTQLDKYEEHLIRRVAELLYVPHSEFIRTKLLAGAEAGLRD